MVMKELGLFEGLKRVSSYAFIKFNEVIKVGCQRRPPILGITIRAA